MWHVIHQAVTPGPEDHSADFGSPRRGAQGTPVTFASQSCLQLSPRLAFDCKCNNNRLRGRWGGAVDFSGCSYLQGWERRACGECPGNPRLLCCRGCCSWSGTLLLTVSSSTAHLCPGGPGISWTPTHRRFIFGEGSLSAGFALAEGGWELLQKIAGCFSGMQSTSQTRLTANRQLLSKGWGCRVLFWSNSSSPHQLKTWPCKFRFSF